MELCEQRSRPALQSIYYNNNNTVRSEVELKFPKTVRIFRKLPGHHTCVFVLFTYVSIKIKSFYHTQASHTKSCIYYMKLWGERSVGKAVSCCGPLSTCSLTRRHNASVTVALLVGGVLLIGINLAW